MKLSPVERFWAKVDRRGGCWLWIAAQQTDGYGSFGWKGRVQLAHRVSFEIVHGAIPPGMEVMHSCDNRPCVNPAHLRLGTHRENMADMIKRRRHGVWTQPASRTVGDQNGTHTHPGCTAGERNGGAKLTEDDVRLIRQLGATTSLATLSRRFGVVKSAVCVILHRKAWKHVA